ncbi:MAG: RHS repeat-associated core domain-containing protein, partial [Myxococcales bacterium]|nr:RHS repeat-associated core domain-containing protein [Myxococcales bacterium]
YWNAVRNAERPQGEGDPGGFVRRVRALAVPAALQAAVYDAAGATPGYDPAQWGEGGHELAGGDAWAPTPVVHYLPEGQFSLPFRAVDPFGGVSEVTHDAHGLFAVAAVNALGHRVTATVDYHALAPVEVVDPNLNHVEVGYDALGAVLKVARKGKDQGGGRWQGRTLAAPHEVYTYARDAWRAGGRPCSVKAEVFTSHDPADAASIVSYAYADGAGQVILTKVQAEPGPAPSQDPVTGALIRDAQGNLQITAPGTARWVGSGRQVLNNKGAPLKQYEPYFSSVPAFDDEAELIYQSPAAVLHYDVLGRPVRTQHPDGTEAWVARFTWSEVAHDASDTVAGSRWAADAGASADPEVRRALALSLAHADTPTVQHLDGLGRVFQVDEDNGTAGAPDLHTTVTALDIQGRALSITDARGNIAGTQRYDLLGRVLALTTADGGARWMLPAVDGQAVRGWDQRGHARRATYDALRRPVSVYLASGGGAETVRAHHVYGEALEVAAAQAENLLGALHEVYDGAGVRTVARYDFDGHPVASSRRLRATPSPAAPRAEWTAYAQGPDWSALPAAGGLAALRAAAAPGLEAETFRQAGRFDALGRPATVTTPDDSVTRYGYNAAGLLDAVDIDLRGAGAWTPFVADIDYDAQGRRARIVHGNGVETSYTYDTESRRLTRLRSRRGGGAVLQDLGYRYDAAGNIVALSDGAQQNTYFDNAAVRPDRRFEYDARHRLVRAEGRCHPGQQPTAALPPERSVPHANDAATLVRYAEAYAYDGVGNIMSMAHTRGGVVAWRRRYQYALASNRLVSTSASMAEAEQDAYYDPAASARYADVYTHDVHGNMTAMPGLTLGGWGAEDWLVEVGLRGGGDVYYSYDGGGERVRKVIRRANGAEVVERLYLDGWELYRRGRGGAEDEVIETLHVMDDRRRVALVETKTVSGGAAVAAPAPRARYQLEDHLGTCTVEVDGSAQANVLTYEEYFPYGATAYRATRAGVDLSPKRYRYTTKERDEETGLDYFGARYYASWLGRWTAADPAGFVDGPNLFQYARSSSTQFVDPTGRETDAEVLDRLRRNNDARNEYYRKTGRSSLADVDKVAVLGLASGIASVPAGVLGVWLGGGSIVAEGLYAGAITGAVNRGLSDLYEGRLSSASSYVDSAAEGGFWGAVGGALGWGLGVALSWVGRTQVGQWFRRGRNLVDQVFGSAEYSLTQSSWQKNAGGVVRTSEEALELSSAAGVEFPDDVLVRFVDDVRYPEYFDEGVLARYSPNPKYGSVGLDDFMDKNGEFVIWVRKSILDSDEAIIATLAHEAYEVSDIFTRLAEGVRIPVERFRNLYHPASRGGQAGNIHDMAWEFADGLILRLREAW